MLRPEDVGPGWRVLETFKGDWLTEILCRGARDVTPVNADPLAFEWVVMTDRPGAPTAAQDQRYHTVMVYLARWPSGVGLTAHRNNFDRLRDCHWELARPTWHVSIVDYQLAGDESFLVELRESSEGLHWYSIFVRKGDVTTEVIVLDDDRELAIRLGRQAAARACEVTDC